MPKIKTKRDDILREEEFREMLNKLRGKDVITGEYVTKLNGEPHIQKFNIRCRMMECLLCLLWMFGKRITEVILLKRKDLWIEDGFLYVRFRVLKRKKKKSVTERYVKRITLDHPYARYITNYMFTVSDPDSFLFPGKSRERIIRVRVKRKMKIYGDRAPPFAEYIYKQNESGFMSANFAWKIVKFLNPDAYCHLFRYSLATRMAEHGYTEDQLMSWFDWRTSDVAHDYVSKGPRLIRQASERTW